MTMPRNRVWYSYKKEYFENEEQRYIAYSVLVFKNQKLIRYIPDVFLHKSDAKKFISLWNKYNLSAYHLDDVIEDFLV